ncbi:type II toxin-antitoxin system Phd/YefM family antitoxin [Mesorhizobium sp. ASY16-5R]|uniref:type II toxin-antitoxin system Phd/YefM family antitoxin n=1 Tax=Mesorhizobium sp. ASY16-5R TaxID=3445772 RepID=UPI003FA061BA
MKELQLKDAKARFSQVVDEAVAGETSVITRHGRRQAVVMGWEEYERLSKVPSLGWLLANSPLEDEDLVERRPARALGENPF